MKFHLLVFGCHANVADSERLRTLLKKLGGTEVETPQEAELLLFVTCAVRQHAEDRVFGFLKRFSRPGLVMAVTGCMTTRTSLRGEQSADPLFQKNPHINIVFQIKDADQLPRLLAPFFPAARLAEFSDEFPGIFGALPTPTPNCGSAFVPISTGCDHRCTFCIVPSRRGDEVCRPRADILADVRAAVENGAGEITLIGQNVNRWYAGERGRNPYQTDFAGLLEEVSRVDGVRWLRFLSPHPQHFGPDVIEVMAKRPNICPHLHLPVQSGDDEILRRMARGYTVERFRQQLADVRAAVPGIAITTDVIVGFCTETEQAFERTLQLAKEESFDQIFIGKFSPRPNTPAKNWPDDVPLIEKKRRFRALDDVVQASGAQNRLAEVSSTCEVLVDRVDEHGTAHGRNARNRRVRFAAGRRGAAGFTGTFVDVRITAGEGFTLVGEMAG